MENPSSPLETLRQLKEMLDAGALTPAEFEALKQRLVFTPAAPAPPAAEPAPAPDAWAAPAMPVAPPLPAPEAPTPTNAPASFPISPAYSAAPNPSNSQPAPPEAAVDARVFEPAPAFTLEASTDFLATAGSTGYVEAEALTDDDAPDFANPPAGRNSSLGLVLAIGAVLVFLAVVAYLGFNRPASEHISSTSQTAADSVATAIEAGPQVAPLPATAAPETVRVAPTNPAPVIQPHPAAPAADSAAPAPKSPAPDSAANR